MNIQLIGRADVIVDIPIQFIWRHQIQSGSKQSLELVNLAKLAWTLVLTGLKGMAVNQHWN